MGWVVLTNPIIAATGLIWHDISPLMFTMLGNEIAISGIILNKLILIWSVGNGWRFRNLRVDVQILSFTNVMLRSIIKNLVRKIYSQQQLNQQCQKITKKTPPRSTIYNSILASPPPNFTNSELRLTTTMVDISTPNVFSSMMMYKTNLQDLKLIDVRSAQSRRCSSKIKFVLLFIYKKRRKYLQAFKPWTKPKI